MTGKQPPATQPDLILFSGPPGNTPVEELVAQAQEAAARDLILRAQEAGCFGKIILATASASPPPPGVILDRDRGPFHFGRRLREILRTHGVEKALYLGCLPLLSTQDLAQAAQQLSGASPAVITNNIYSSDLVAFAPAQALERIELPETDNPLAWLLHSQGGLPYRSLPPSAATLFDLDTPTDLMVLKLHPRAGPRAKAYLDPLGLDLGPLRRALALFDDPSAQVLVAGRVSSLVWSRLERDTRCHVRLLAEERGMRAEGKGGHGEVRSLLGFYLEAVGVPRFFQTLGELAQAVFLDSRVIFHHRRLPPSTADRFYSDLGQPEKIGDPFLREFTGAAREAPFPVILGGHSLVSGGLLALLEICQQGQQAARHPVDNGEALG